MPRGGANHRETGTRVRMGGLRGFAFAPFVPVRALRGPDGSGRQSVMKLSHALSGSRPVMIAGLRSVSSCASSALSDATVGA